MTHMQLNFTFDLGTPEGRAEFRRMCGHLLKADAQVKVKSSVVEEEGYPGSLVPAAEVPPDAVRANDPAPTAPSLTARQEAAAKARAAKAAKAAGAPIENGEDLSGPAPNGADADAEDIGLVDPGMSPAEAKDAALAVVREIYEAGQTAQVRALQKAWGGGKFYDLPDEKGHEFYRQVMKMAHETGLRK